MNLTKINKPHYALFIFLLFITPLTVFSQSPLSIQDIMKGDDFVGHLPSNIEWSEDGKTIYFQWNPENNPADSLYKFTLGAKTPMKVSQKERRNIPSFRGEYNSDHSRKTYESNGDIFMVDVKSLKITQITNTPGREHSPYFHGQNIHFISDNNLFEWDTSSGTLKQLTDFKLAKAPQSKKDSDQDKWLREDQKALSEVINERHEKEELQKSIRKSSIPKRPKTIYLGDKRLRTVTMSPQKDYITYTVSAPAKQKDTMVPDFVTMSGYTESSNARSKVGSEPDDVESWIYNLSNDSIYQVQTKDLPGIRDQPDFFRDYPKLANLEPEIREVYTHSPVWSEDGRYAVIVHRSQDNKDRWITLLDPETGANKLLDRQRDEAWIGGPGIGYGAYSGGEIGWLPDNKSIWFQSEESGYSHLYTIDVTTGNKKPLTSGSFEIYNPQISRDKKSWYFSSNEANPGQRHFYSMPLKGGKRTKITTGEGSNDVTISPDEKKLAILHSYANQPWELYVMDNNQGAEMTKITSSTTEEFEAYNWRIPEFIKFKARDGAEVPARLYKPKNPNPGGPAVIFVHGAGYLQNAHQWWSSYYREYMFHNFLVDNGYTVLDIDYRGSSGYGRDWRTAIYRHMGGWDLSDNVDGAKYLIDKHGIGEDKIGIYGGSYGGFITLMGLFTTPEVFAAGAALRSVTDWAHYNHAYTSNILNTPVLDSIAYRKSSPIYYAENLNKPLLIAHGMIDDNVHFQDVVRLAQRLIELGKDDWEMAVYPVERHGFTEPSSWADEYKRIFKLFEEHLK